MVAPELAALRAQQYASASDAELIFNLAGWTYIHLRRSHHWSPTRARAAITDQILRSLTPQTPAADETRSATGQS